MTIIFLGIGIALIALNINKLKDDKQNSFLSVINEKEKDFSDINLDIAKIRKNIGESLTDLQLEIQDLRDQVSYLKFKINELEKNKNIEELTNIRYNKIEKKEKNVIRKELEDSVINEINFENKSKKDKIKKLIEDGLTDEEICASLDIGKGEVLLIRGLLK
jgi:TolA-binding protein